MEDPVENGAPETAEGHAIVDTIVTDAAEGELTSLPAEGGSESAGVAVVAPPAAAAATAKATAKVNSASRCLPPKFATLLSLGFSSSACLLGFWGLID
jgi:hypothetical protein